LRCEVSPESVNFRVGSREGAPIRREGVEWVRVEYPPWTRPTTSYLVVRRTGARIDERRHFGRFDPTDMAEALRRAGWPVTEQPR